MERELDNLELDNLIVRADEAISNARRLRQELSDNIAIARAQCQYARQAEIFQTGLHPAVSISLLVRNGEKDIEKLDGPD